MPPPAGGASRRPTPARSASHSAGSSQADKKPPGESHRKADKHQVHQQRPTGAPAHIHSWRRGIRHRRAKAQTGQEAQQRQRLRLVAKAVSRL